MWGNYLNGTDARRVRPKQSSFQHTLNRQSRLHLGRTNRASVPVKQNPNRVPSKPYPSKRNPNHVTSETRPNGTDARRVRPEQSAFPACPQSQTSSAFRTHEPCVRTRQVKSQSCPEPPPLIKAKFQSGPERDPAQTVRTHGACVLNNQHSPHALNRKPRLHLGRTNRASVPVKQNSNRVPSGIPLNPLWIIAVLIPPFDIRPYVIHNTVTVERSSNNMVMIAIVPTELYAMTFSK